MSALVYHHTDTGRLPWILKAGVLQPGRNRLGSYPDPDFLWATTRPEGDRTASASLDALRAGLTRAVRFTLPAEAFTPWSQIVTGIPAWTPDQITRLEQAAGDQSDPRDWRCRAETLPSESWIGIETRSWTDRTWRPLDPIRERVALDEHTLGIEIDGTLHLSRRLRMPDGNTGYQVASSRRRRAA